MKKPRPPQITPTHLTRRAVAYQRRSTPRKSGETGNTLSQTTQARLARRWGWTTGAIQTIDEAPGGNGATGERRPGYEQLCEQIARGEVGIVLVSDLSRLTRSSEALAQFYALCRQHATLIAVDGVLVDRTNPVEDLMDDIRRAVTVYESEQRRAWLRARRAKASARSKREA